MLIAMMKGITDHSVSSLCEPAIGRGISKRRAPAILDDEKDQHAGNQQRKEDSHAGKIEVERINLA